MKYALYCRVSTETQTTQNQKEALINYANNNGFEFDLYEETQSTRKTRPIKQEVLRKLRAREYKGVIIWKLDRWARSSQELILEVEELVKKEISFISITDNIDLSTASGRLHFNILSAFASFERDLIKERVIEGLKRAKASGVTLGRRKGSKDKKTRKKGGYYLRYNKKKEFNT